MELYIIHAVIEVFVLVNIKRALHFGIILNKQDTLHDEFEKHRQKSDIIAKVYVAVKCITCLKLTSQSVC